MSLVENQALRNDTLDYIRQTPIISFDLEQLSPDGGEHLKMKIADSELWSVKGKSRIVATDLLRKGDSVIVKVKLKAEDLGAAVANDWMPTYWLPWGRNRVVRTTLRPRSLTTRTGAPKEGKDLDITRIHVNNVHYAQDSNDPVFFLTSSVNGCAVFVEGPEEQPTVYHGNAIGVKDEQGRGPMDLALAGKGGGRASARFDRAKGYDHARSIQSVVGWRPEADARGRSLCRPGRQGHHPGRLPNACLRGKNWVGFRIGSEEGNYWRRRRERGAEQGSETQEIAGDGLWPKKRREVEILLPEARLLRDLAGRSA